MKKYVFILILILLLSFPTYAHGQSIIDQAGLLTDSQIQDLEQQAKQIEDDYQIDVVILTVSSTGGKDVVAFADDFYDDNGYGPDGILLLLVMDSREWAISTCGSVMQTMSSNDCDSLFYSASDYFSAGAYEQGFSRYLSQLPMYVFPSLPDAVPPEMPELARIGISLLIGAVIAGITVFIMVRSMHSARPKRSAAEYVDRNTFRLHTQRDFYLYSTTTRTKIESNSSGSHRSSSGRSHGGSRGRF